MKKTIVNKIHKDKRVSVCHKDKIVKITFSVCHKDKIVKITFSIQFQINKVLQEEIKLTLREKQL